MRVEAAIEQAAVAILVVTVAAVADTVVAAEAADMLLHLTIDAPVAAAVVVATSTVVHQAAVATNTAVPPKVPLVEADLKTKVCLSLLNAYLAPSRQNH